MIQSNLNICEIKSWLTDNVEKVRLDISNSTCRKWENWLEDNSVHIYPCVCSVREQDCIFIEIYYKLYGLERYLKLESHFEQVLSEYEKICQSESALLNWMQKHKLDWDNLTSLDSVVKIKVTSEPYKTLDIQIDKDGFEHCFKFKELYAGIYYSDNYQKHINS